MANINRKVKEIHGCSFDAIPEYVLKSNEPLLLKGLVKDWPAVQAARQSDQSIADYIKSFHTDQRVVLYHADASKKGRFFYTDDMDSLDFKTSVVPLDVVLDRLIQCKSEPDPDTYYVGSTTVDVCLPGFRAGNDLQLHEREPLVSIWIGNRSTVAAHFDAPYNIACCVAGKRRFTVFSIDQVENLYVGPLDKTPSGQSISMVDFDNPDYKRYPKFRVAEEVGLVADMEPGDGFYLPSMWWHHVQSFSDFNCLVNYWWRSAPRYMDPPMNVLRYAILSIRDLPQREKEAWRTIFNHYIFDDQDGKYDHIPTSARGFLNPVDNISSRQLRSWLLNKLKS